MILPLHSPSRRLFISSRCHSSPLGAPFLSRSPWRAGGRGGECSHQYLWLCYRRSTLLLLEGRAINGIQGRPAQGQQAGERGSAPGALQSIAHYRLSISGEQHVVCLAELD